ncbi:hypothetical protein [Nitrosospira sp. Nsp1]|uniref:hypothetical protein n=1 Tax=Nitrosospira sp. Nsp1 TaxID=136547 RepID=UPI00088594AB|nr:hypothetical protein [Nitrosospira sp. Nsp1]SCX53128.1 hypothetical protein SAMN05720354_11278 [Nitrosospira sp. Nsp1]
MNMMSVGILRLISRFAFAVILGGFATFVQAECAGCLCPGNPCKLCPLPPQKNAPPVADEPNICLKIRERVTPVSKHTEPNQHYESVNKSITECVRNGGDVIMNSRRNEEFPSKHYCKPYIAEGKANADGAHLAPKK